MLFSCKLRRHSFFVSNVIQMQMLLWSCYSSAANTWIMIRSDFHSILTKCIFSSKSQLLKFYCFTYHPELRWDYRSGPEWKAWYWLIFSLTRVKPKLTVSNSSSQETKNLSNAVCENFGIYKNNCELLFVKWWSLPHISLRFPIMITTVIMVIMVNTARPPKL